MMEPDRKCPKCKNNTLHFFKGSLTWICTHETKIGENSIPCGFFEKYDSISAILRGISLYLDEIVRREEDTGIAIELSELKDKTDEILANKDQAVLEFGKL